MIGYLIYPATTPRENNAFSWFCDAAMQNGITLKVLFYNSPQVEKHFTELPLPDFVFMRGYHIPLSQWYHSQGVRVINSPQSMIACRDKYTTYKILSQAGIPTPQTLPPFEPLPSDEQSYMKCKETFGTPFILKQIFGSKGENVYLINNFEQYEQAVIGCLKSRSIRIEESGKLSEYGSDMAEIEYGTKVIAQEYISSSFGKDIRVWVFRGKVIGNILRYNENDFKSNFAQGGSFTTVTLPDNGAEIAVKAAAAVGLDFAGVDLLYLGEEDFTVCEINGNPGFRTAKSDIPLEIFSNFNI